MDIATVIGILSGTILVFVAIFMGGGWGIFFNLPSIMITVGGTFASTLINYPLPKVVGITNVVRKAFFHRLPEHTEVITLLVDCAERARRDGILSLEHDIPSMPDKFLQQGLRLMIDGVDSETICQVLSNEIEFSRERHKIGQGIFTTMATYAPAYGMIGTLIGLVQMLRNLSDPAKIGPGMAVALLTTFYGALMAYLVFSPIAGKLKTRSQEETLLRELIIEGIMSIQSGDNPRIVATKLKAFVAPKLREQV